MGTLKLLTSEFNEIDFQLLAIHCPFEGYRLAFFINKILKINLTRTKNKLQVVQKNGGSNFERFSFDDIKNDRAFDLIENKNTVNANDGIEINGLFFESSTRILTPVFLVPEFKKVDYFLRIASESEIKTKITAEIKKIKLVTTVYEINTDKIKSRNNLIF